MDNEPEIWSGTHDDVQKEPVSAEEFLSKYLAVAQAAKKIWPEIKLVGPISCNEWQWYAGSNNKGVVTEEKTYTWVEYFIKRIAEEEAKCGTKLLDVFSIHFYPSKLTDAEVLQCHRIYFDEGYDYPQANGIKRISGVWDNNSTKEYILKRCRDWMLEHLGEVRAVGVTETGIESKDPNICSIWYASTVGEFMKQGVEIFSPWSWKPGMWETLHLFARYNQPYYLDASSSNDSLVSVHATINEQKDSMSVLLINRSMSEPTEVEINLSNFNLQDGDYLTLELSDLPEEETFVSHTINALKPQKTTFSNGKATLTLPPLSTTTVVLNRKNSSDINLTEKDDNLVVYPTSTKDLIYISGIDGKCTVQIISTDGKSLLSEVCEGDKASLNIGHLPVGYYLCAVSLPNVTKTFHILKQ